MATRGWWWQVVHILVLGCPLHAADQHLPVHGSGGGHLSTEAAPQNAETEGLDQVTACTATLYCGHFASLPFSAL